MPNFKLEIDPTTLVDTAQELVKVRDTYLKKAATMAQMAEARLESYPDKAGSYATTAQAYAQIATVLQLQALAATMIAVS